jgi:hypothetical protein
MVSFKVLTQKGFVGTLIYLMKLVRGYLGQRFFFDWWMSTERAARDKQPILPTSTNPCIPRAAGIQWGKVGQQNTCMSIFTCIIVNVVK